MNSRNRTIIKNSLWLYLRMIVITIISLYTSRIVLQALGVDDFGIYNVTSGVIAFLSVLTTTMTNSTQRFLNAKKGENDVVGLRMVFNISVSIHTLLALALLVVAETIGLFFVMKILVFPQERYVAAILTYQAAIFTLFFSILKIPFTSLVITYEKFDFIALISLIDVVVKLALVFSLLYISLDKLILYAWYFAILSLIQFGVYTLYTKKWYERICLLKPALLLKDKDSRSIISFSSWNLLGNFSNTLANQGIAVIFNLYYVLVVNAALGITNQVTNTIATFVNNVQLAFRPQLLQSYSYSDSDKSVFLQLLYNSSKWSFYLIMLVGIPFICNLDWIMKIWLVNVPEYTVQFVFILFLFLVVDTVGVPLFYALEAEGHIKKFQICNSMMMLLNFLIACFFCYLALSPVFAILSKLFTNVVVYLIKVYFLKKNTSCFNLTSYYHNCIKPLIKVSLFLLSFYYFFYTPTSCLSHFVISSACFLVLYPVAVFILGMNRGEKTSVKIIVNNYIRKI